jgi:hypothetical protein
MRGIEHQPAAKLQRTEPPASGFARIERLDRLGADFDSLDRIAVARRLRRRRDQREREDGQQGRSAGQANVQDNPPESDLTKLNRIRL